MITFRYGKPNNEGVRPNSISFQYPLWELDGPIVEADDNRVFTAKVFGGSNTHALGSDPSTLRIPLKCVPWRNVNASNNPAPLPVNYLSEVRKMVPLKGQEVDIFWGADEWGTWTFKRVTIQYEDPTPYESVLLQRQNLQGLYFKTIRVVMELIVDVFDVTPDTSVAVTNTTPNVLGDPDE